MDSFIRRRNIAHYRALLERPTGEAQRQLLLKLLAEEEAKQWGGSQPKEK